MSTKPNFRRFHSALMFQAQFSHTYSNNCFNTHISSTVSTHTFQLQFEFEQKKGTTNDNIDDPIVQDIEALTFNTNPDDQFGGEILSEKNSNSNSDQSY